MKTTRALTLLALTASAASGLFGLPAAAAAQQRPAALSPSTQQSLDSLLAKAVAENDISDARALLDKGAYANTLLSEHKAGGTVLHAAALDGHIDLVKCLLDHGADPIHRNTHFKTARDLAQESGHNAIADVLRTAEEGSYTPSTAPKPAPVPAAPAVPKAVTPKGAAKAAATSRTQTKRSSGVARKSKAGRPPSAAERQAKAMKKLNDYNYVKQNFGLGGATYPSTKW